MDGSENIRFIEAKTILSKLRQADTWFGIMYNMNLYRGCQHGCIYCDTRSECYGVGDISRVSVKRNALELLADELKAKRNSKGTIGTGSMNDPYMPIEREMGLTRRALQVIADRKFPAHVITKGELVRRDTDVLQQISGVYAAVSFTITTADESLGSKLEPHASPVGLRFDAMRHLAENGIYTGITMMPLLPFINDRVDQVKEILQKAKDNGASYVVPMFGMTLRKGSREYFYGMLDRHFPGMRQRYETTFGEQYECFSPAYRDLNKAFLEETDRLGLSRRIKFFQPPSDPQLSLF